MKNRAGSATLAGRNSGGGHASNRFPSPGPNKQFPQLQNNANDSNPFVRTTPQGAHANSFDGLSLFGNHRPHSASGVLGGPGPGPGPGGSASGGVNPHLHHRSPYGTQLGQQAAAASQQSNQAPNIYNQLQQQQSRISQIDTPKRRAQSASGHRLGSNHQQRHIMMLMNSAAAQQTNTNSNTNIKSGQEMSRSYEYPAGYATMKHEIASSTYTPSPSSAFSSTLPISATTSSTSSTALAMRNSTSAPLYSGAIAAPRPHSASALTYQSPLVTSDAYSQVGSGVGWYGLINGSCAMPGPMAAAQLVAAATASAATDRTLDTTITAGVIPTKPSNEPTQLGASIIVPGLDPRFTKLVGILSSKTKTHTQGVPPPGSRGRSRNKGIPNQQQQFRLPGAGAGAGAGAGGRRVTFSDPLTCHKPMANPFIPKPRNTSVVVVQQPRPAPTPAPSPAPSPALSPVPSPVPITGKSNPTSPLMFTGESAAFAESGVLTRNALESTDDGDGRGNDVLKDGLKTTSINSSNSTSQVSLSSSSCSLSTIPIASSYTKAISAGDVTSDVGSGNHNPSSKKVSSLQSAIHKASLFSADLSDLGATDNAGVLVEQPSRGNTAAVSSDITASSQQAAVSSNITTSSQQASSQPTVAPVVATVKAPAPGRPPLFGHAHGNMNYDMVRYSTTTQSGGATMTKKSPAGANAVDVTSSSNNTSNTPPGSRPSSANRTDVKNGIGVRVQQPQKLLFMGRSQERQQPQLPNLSGGDAERESGTGSRSKLQVDSSPRSSNSDTMSVDSCSMSIDSGREEFKSRSNSSSGSSGSSGRTVVIAAASAGPVRGSGAGVAGNTGVATTLAPTTGADSDSGSGSVGAGAGAGDGNETIRSSTGTGSGKKGIKQKKRPQRPSLSEQLATIGDQAQSITSEIRANAQRNDGAAPPAPLDGSPVPRRGAGAIYMSANSSGSGSGQQLAQDPSRDALFSMPAKCFSIGSLNCRFPAPVYFYANRCEYMFNHPYESTVINMIIYYKDMQAINIVGTRFRFKLNRKLALFLGDFDPQNPMHMITLELSTMLGITTIREKIVPLINQAKH